MKIERIWAFARPSTSLRLTIALILLIAGFSANAQVYTALPSGAVPYSNQIYRKISGSDTTYYTGASGKGFVKLGGYADVLRLQDSIADLRADKVDKVPGKSLLADSEITRLLTMATGATANRSDAATDALLNAKVDKTTTVNGKALSANVTVTKTDVGLGSVPDVDATNAGNISSGTLADGRLSGNVTMQGNSFNSALQLLKLDAGGKVPMGNLPATLMIYIGMWDLSTNTPALSDGTSTAGYVYKVTGAPSTANFNFGSGNIALTNGDYIIYSNSGKWEKSDGTDQVTSVNGQQGIVMLTKADVGLGSVEDKSSATIRSEITSANVTTALGYTPYNSSNPAGYISSYTETDPGVPAYAKSLSAFSVIKASTDVLYKPIGYAPAWGDITGTVPVWNQNTTGNAQTATNSTQWNGLVRNFGTESSTPTGLLTYESGTGSASYMGSSNVKAWLGITGGPFLPLTGGSGSPLSGDLVISKFNSGIDLNTTSGVGNIAFRASSTYQGYIGAISGGGLEFGTGASASIRYTIDASGNNTWIGSGTFGGPILTTSSLLANQTSTGLIDFFGGNLRLWGFGSAGVEGGITFRTGVGGTSSTERMNLTSTALNVLVPQTGTSATFSQDITSTGFQTTKGYVSRDVFGTGFNVIGNTTTYLGSTGGIVGLIASNTEIMRLTSTGVGIGTTTPDVLTNYTFLTTNNPTTGGGITMKQNGTTRMAVYNAGNVGYIEANSIVLGTGGTLGSTPALTIASNQAITAASSFTAAGNLSGANLSGTNTGDQTWSTLSGKPTFAAVATSGAYGDLSGRPTSLSSFTNDPGFITSAALANYVNTTGDQTGISGNKGWAGFHSFGGVTSSYYRLNVYNSASPIPSDATYGSLHAYDDGSLEFVTKTSLGKRIKMNFGSNSNLTFQDGMGTVAFLSDISASALPATGWTNKQVLFGNSSGGVSQSANLTFDTSSGDLILIGKLDASSIITGNVDSNSDVEVLQAANGLILRDTNSVRYRVTVNTSGALVVTAL